MRKQASKQSNKNKEPIIHEQEQYNIQTRIKNQSFMSKSNITFKQISKQAIDQYIKETNKQANKQTPKNKKQIPDNGAKNLMCSH